MFKYRQYGTQTAVIKKYTQVKEQESDVQLYVKDIKPKQNRARHPHESRGTDQLPAASIKEGKKKKLFPLLHTPEVSQVSLKIWGDQHKLTKHVRTIVAEGKEAQRKRMEECISRQQHKNKQRQ